MQPKQMADIVFIALTLWREARGESIECREAIAGVIMNRVSRPSWWGTDAMSVCFKKWQFSSLTDPRDRQLVLWPKSNDKQWLECLDIAEHAVTVGFDCGGADHYYDVSIRPPKWADQKKFVKQIGNVRFYNLDKDTEE